MQELINDLNIIKNATSEVYEAGQENAVDADKIIEKSVSGNRFVIANDVSEVRHDVTINAPSGTELNVYGKNLFDIDSRIYTVRTGLTVTKNEDGTYNIRGNLPTSTNYQYCGELSFYIPSGTTVTTSTYFDTPTETACIGIVLKNSSGSVIHQHSGNYVNGESKTTTLTSDCTTVGFVWKFANGVSGSYIEINNIRLQLELYGKSTEYETFKGQNVTVDSTGEAKVTSCSPKMLIACDSNADITMNYRKSYGVQTEYDRFWDTIQNYGKRTNYWYAFAGDFAWLFTVYGGIPKYDIVLKDTTSTTRSCNSMFMGFNRNKTINGMIDMSEICKHIDFSGCTQAISVFQNAKAKNITCDFSNCTSLSSCFNCSDGGQLDYINIKVTEKCTGFGNTFHYCSALTEFRFLEGSVVAATISFSRSTKLSHDSIVNIVNTLSTTVTGKTLSLSKTAVNTAFETSEGAADGSTSTEWTNLVATKSNWTFSLS